MIIVIWLTKIDREAAQFVSYEIPTSHEKFLHNTLYISFYAVSLFVMNVSYILIVTKSRYACTDSILNQLVYESSNLRSRFAF